MALWLWSNVKLSMWFVFCNARAVIVFRLSITRECCRHTQTSMNVYAHSATSWKSSLRLLPLCVFLLLLNSLCFSLVTVYTVFCHLWIWVITYSCSCKCVKTSIHIKHSRQPFEVESCVVLCLLSHWAVQVSSLFICITRPTATYVSCLASLQPTFLELFKD